MSNGFRPLAGISYNYRNAMPARFWQVPCFRPLAGNSSDIKKHGQTTDGFRPLTGINCNVLTLRLQ